MVTRGLALTYRTIVGKPLPTTALAHQRLSKVKALAVLASDALSSVAYATQEILNVLIIAGVLGLEYAWTIAVAISVLIVIVGFSYRQTIHAYPNGGGSYIVAKENLGTYPGLVAGAALLIDYVLTVAVSVTAGVAATVSAFSMIQPFEVEVALGCVLIITFANLRGIKESGTVFTVPTYLFVGSFLTMILVGIWRVSTGQIPVEVAAQHLPQEVQSVTLFLILRAFASGCTALTGIEAISDGVPVFEKPTSKNASMTLQVLVGMLVVMFLGATWLSHNLSILPMEEGQPGYMTVTAQIARLIFGDSIGYYAVQATTTLILVLAANTSYADFPRLASFIARDRYLPRQMTELGDRLVFANGILLLGFLSSVLIFAFGGHTHALIPLYAVGVFLSFTLSQSGMVMRWWRKREEFGQWWINLHWWRSILINATGALVTFGVLVIITITKFMLGAWVVVLLIPLLFKMFLKIHSHYVATAEQLRLVHGVDELVVFNPNLSRNHLVILPIAGVHRGSMAALRYANSLSSYIKVVYIEINPEETERVKAQFKEWTQGFELTVIESPFRSVVGPLLEFIRREEKALNGGNGIIKFLTIVVPEFQPVKLWQFALHKQTAPLLRALLAFRSNRVIAGFRYRLAH